MNKIILAILFTLGLFSAAFAGVNMGVSAQLGVFNADAKETEKSEISPKGEATGIVGYSSIFLEKTLGDRLQIGIDYVPYALESDTTEDNKVDGASTVVNKVQIDFEDLLTFYASLNLTDNLYVRYGITQVDVITNESLGTGSTYGNTSLDGTVYGIGYHQERSNGMFYRIEGNIMEFDKVSLTSGTNADNKIDMSEINGASGKITIGKSF